MFVLPFEDAPEKFLAAEIVPRFLFRSPQMFFHRRLRPDAGVIDPREARALHALHPGATRENVLDRVVEHVPKREHAGDVRRRHDDRKRRLCRMRIRVKIAGLQPACVPFLLDARRIVIFWKVRHRCEYIAEHAAIASR